MNPSVTIPTEQLTEFAKRWRLSELSLFGSILRDDFRPDSDVDVCVVFDPAWDYDIDDLFRMRDELGAIFGGRSVDLVQRKNIRNPFMRHRIITTRRVIYAA